MVNKVKKQHYVPQFYLKKFQIKDSNSKIYVYDKLNGNIMKNSISDIASEKYFYDHDIEKMFNEMTENQKQEIKEKITSDDLDKFNSQYLEKWFSVLEGECAKVLKSILENAEKAYKNSWYQEKCFCMSREEKAVFAYYVCIQYFRTKNMRENIADAWSKLTKTTSERFLALESTKVNFDKEAKKLLHEDTLFNNETIKKTSKIIENHVWNIYINKTNIPFWTSDNPVALCNQLSESRGIAAKGVEVLFPLSPQITLSMMGKNYFAHIKDKIEDRRYIIITDEDIIHGINMHQLIDAQRFVFSNQEDFSEAKIFFESHPELKTPLKTVDIY